MKWYITNIDRVADGIDSVRIEGVEMGSEAAGIAVKWPYRPVVTRSVMVEEPIMLHVYDELGNPVLNEFGEQTYRQEGTRWIETQQAVSYPYIVLDGEELRSATDDERAAIDAVLAAKAAAEAAASLESKRAAIIAQLNDGVIALALAYRTALRAMFGESAETNHAITQDVVVGTLMQLPPEQYDAKTADLLELAFETLTGITGDGTTWTFYELVGDLIPEGGA